MSVDTEEKFIKIKASHSKTLYPSAGIGSDGKNWGIVSWNILEVEQGNPTMSVYGEVTFTGEYTDGIDPNSAYVLLGKEVEHPKYGVQYQLVYYNKDIDFSNQKNQRAFLRTFLSEGQMDELFAVCDDPLQAIADHDIETLKKAKGIGDYISNCIIERFEASKDMSTVYLELDKVGFSPNFISKLIEKYKAPQKVIDIVKNNPYQLVKDIKGVGFFTADKVALRSGYKTYDTKRIKSYILWYLDAQGEEGHSWVSAGELMGSLYEDLGGKQSLIVEDEDGNLVNNVGKAIKELQDEELIRVEEGDTKSGRRVYLMSFWNLEKDIAYHLKRLLQGNNYFVANDFEEKIKRAEEIKTDIADIYFIEGQGHNAVFHTLRGDYSSRVTLKELEEKLIVHNFFRCAKGYLVNMNHVEGIVGSDCVIHSVHIPVSRTRKKEFMNKLLQNLNMD